jgi:hypothetical protein
MRLSGAAASKRHPSPNDAYAGFVPKRSTLFQEVVSVIYSHLADGASIEESAMLTNRVTGEKREVDVVLRTRTAGVEVVIGVEATGLSEARRQASLQPEAPLQPDPVDVGWVEEMIGKHKNLPTDKVVLVSETGFTRQARVLAVADAERKMIPIWPEMLGSGDLAFGILNAVRALWPKQIDITPWKARVWVDRPGEGVGWFYAPQDLNVFVEEDVFTDLGTLIMACVDGPGFSMRLKEEIGFTDIAEDMETVLAFNTGPGWTLDFGPDGGPRSFYLEDGKKKELQRIDAIEITVKVNVHVDQQIPLHHRRLAEMNVNYAFGEGSIGGEPALIVATEDEQGGKVSIRLNPKYKKKSNKKSKRKKKSAS